MIEKVSNRNEYDGLYWLRLNKKRNNLKSIEGFDLSDDVVKKIDKLNNKLIEFEKSLRSKIDMLLESNKWLEKIELYLHFHLDVEDELYFDGEDNTIVILQSSYYDKKDFNWGIADGNCHNIIPISPDKSFKQQKHCYTLHSLYDHTNDLSLDEILAIGSISLKFELICDEEKLSL